MKAERKKPKVGDVYKQIIHHAEHEYIEVTSIFNDEFYFTIHFVDWLDGNKINTSPGEGHIETLSNGLDDGDIIKVDENELISFICKYTLLE